MPVELTRKHPNVHQPWADWSEDATLHVAAAYSNPFRWATRRKLADNFRRHMEQSPNVQLHLGELAYGNRPFEITDAVNTHDVQLRTQFELFHKENILNSCIRRFPADWQYGMVCDADFHFTRHDWALETIHQLQHYDFVQPFSSYVDLSGDVYGTAQMPTRQNTGFFFNYVQNGFKVSPYYFNTVVGADGKRIVAPREHEYSLAMGTEGQSGTFMRGTGATGGALAFRRLAFDAVGGMLDRCILGHGDWYMAFGLVDEEPPDIHVRGYSEDYLGYIRAWRKRAQAIRKNVGYTDGMAIHYFHGSKTRRAYSSRDLILSKHKYSPLMDVYPDWQGIMQLSPDKPALRDDIRAYFISRSEDDANLYGSEKVMV